MVQIQSQPQVRHMQPGAVWETGDTTREWDRVFQLVSKSMMTDQ